MANIFIFHGAYGNPEENWFPWLRKEIEKDDHPVFVPAFPTPEAQTLERWRNVFEPYEKFVDQNTIFIGHSLGVPFALTLLEKHPIHAAFFVAGFIGKLGNQFDEGNKTFSQKSFDWEKIKNHCQHFSLYHGENDPYVSKECAERVSEKLEEPLKIIPNAGHFNVKAGYDHFDLLLQEVKQILK